VATDDNGVIGWARLFPWKQRGIDVVEDLVYVDPVHHGQGIGRALLTELIGQATGLGYKTIVATVATDNRSASSCTPSSVSRLSAPSATPRTSSTAGWTSPWSSARSNRSPIPVGPPGNLASTPRARLLELAD